MVYKLVRVVRDEVETVPTTRYSFCGSCFEPELMKGSKQNKCRNISCDDFDTSHHVECTFVQTSVADQLTKLLECKIVQEKIIAYQDKMDRVPQGYIVDVQQSSRYLELKDQFRSRSPIPLLSLGFNVDRVRSIVSTKNICRPRPPMCVRAPH